MEEKQFRHVVLRLMYPHGINLFGFSTILTTKELKYCFQYTRYNSAFAKQIHLFQKAGYA